MKKSIIKIAMVFFAIMFIFGIKNYVMAYDPTPEEAEQILKKIPAEINLDIKETECLRAREIVNEKIVEILGREDIYIELYLKGTAYGEDSENIDIHYMNVIICDNSEEYVEHNKQIKLNYTNSSDWNQTDSEYVKTAAAKTNFFRRWDYEINADGTSEDYQNKDNFTWTSVLQIANEGNVSDIKVIEESRGMGASMTSEFHSYILYLFKNDIFYCAVEGGKEDTARITIPNNIEETDEAYMNYAKPILEKYFYSEYTYDETTYQYKYTVKSMKRERNDFINFEFEIQEDTYINGELDSTFEYGRETIIIAKESEYRGTTNANLKEIKISKEEEIPYVLGKLEVTETIVGYEYGFGPNIATIKLIDDVGKEYETEVIQLDDKTFEFKLEITKLSNSTTYKIYVETPFENNKSPLKNTTVIDNDFGEKVLTENNINIEIKNSTEGVILKSLESTKEVEIGDANGDGRINTVDAIRILQHISKKIVLDEGQALAADTNKDGKINTIDVIRILQYISKKIPQI